MLLGAITEPTNIKNLNQNASSVNGHHPVIPDQHARRGNVRWNVAYDDIGISTDRVAPGQIARIWSYIVRI